MKELLDGKTSLQEFVASTRRDGYWKHKKAQIWEVLTSVDLVTIGLGVAVVLLCAVDLWDPQSHLGAAPAVVHGADLLMMEGNSLPLPQDLKPTYVDLGDALEDVDLTVSYRSVKALSSDVNVVVPREKAGVGFLVCFVRDERSSRERRVARRKKATLTPRRILVKVDRTQWERAVELPSLEVGAVSLRSLRRLHRVWGGEPKLLDDAGQLRREVGALAGNQTLGKLLFGGLPFGSVRRVSAAERLLLELGVPRRLSQWRGVEKAGVVVDTTVLPPWGWGGRVCGMVVATLLLFRYLARIATLLSDTTLPAVAKKHRHMFRFAASLLHGSAASGCFGDEEEALERELQVIDRFLQERRDHRVRSIVAVNRNTLAFMAQRCNSTVPCVIVLPRLSDVRCIQLDPKNKRILSIFLSTESRRTPRVLPRPMATAAGGDEGDGEGGGVGMLRRSESLDDLHLNTIRTEPLANAPALLQDLTSVISRASPPFRLSNAELPLRLEAYHQAREEAEERDSYDGRAAAASHVVASIAANWRTYEKKEDAENCAICLGELEAGDKVSTWPQCTHVFHTECAKNQALQSHLCPLCRAPVEAAPLPPGPHLFLRLLGRALMARHVEMGEIQ